MCFCLDRFVLQLPKKILSEIQHIFKNFVWAGKKSRVKVSIMQQKKDQGGLSLPNIAFCYQAALLETLMQWWNSLNKCSWEFEQLGLYQCLYHSGPCVKFQPLVHPSNLIAVTLFMYLFKAFLHRLL